VEPQEVDSIIRHLAAAIAKQDTINDDLRACIREQRAMNERVEGFIQQQVENNADVKTTLARVETLLSRMLQQSENGRDV
jgi:hypothetical protein